MKENYEKGKARVARERAAEKLYEASEFNELAERNYKTANELREQADALREQAEGLNGEAAEKLNEKADWYEQRAEKYESRGEKYNGHKERMEKEAGDLNARSESIREKYDKKETYPRDALVDEQIRSGPPAAGVDAATMSDLFNRVYSSDFIEQPVEETASYDPQLDEITANTAASVNGQSYLEITIDPMEIEPLAHLDYPATGIGPGLPHTAAPAPTPVEPAVSTMSAEEVFNFQQMAASTLEPTQIIPTTSVAEEIPGLPQGAVVLDAANPEAPPPSDGTATGGYYQIPTFSKNLGTGK